MRHGISGYTNQKCRCPVCKAAKKVYDSERYQRNKDRLLVLANQYHVSHRDTILVRKREQWEQNSDRESKRNRYSPEVYKAYMETPSFVAQNNRKSKKRRALKLGALVELTDRVVVFERDKGICGICKELVIGKFHVDHIIPLSKGGKECYSNVQLAHPTCNLKKSAKILA